MEAWDPFRELSFDGRPSGYRDFRRKVILGVAGLEDKIQHLAGPRLLQRLHGEAWRATEHLTVSTLRSTEGWLQVLKALDEHYKYLPETELHEAIDEFMFLLKKRNNEGATAFASRFKTQLSRPQSLIAQERETSRRKRRKKVDEEANPLDDSSVEESERMDPEVKLLMQLLPQTLHHFLRRALENEKVLCEAGATVVIVLMEPVLLPDQHGAQVVVFDDLEKKLRGGPQGCEGRDADAATVGDVGEIYYAPQASVQAPVRAEVWPQSGTARSGHPGYGRFIQVSGCGAHHARVRHGRSPPGTTSAAAPQGQARGLRHGVQRRI